MNKRIYVVHKGFFNDISRNTAIMHQNISENHQIKTGNCALPISSLEVVESVEDKYDPLHIVEIG